MSGILKVLLVDDSKSDALLITRLLDREWDQVDLFRVETRATMKKALKEGSWDIILSDQAMPEFNALEALKILNQSGMDLPFIVTSGVIDMEKAVSMSLLKLGAHDFVEKNDTARLVPAIIREIREAKVRNKMKMGLKKLAESEKRFRYLYNAAPIAYFCVGLDGCINNCNLSAGNLMRCTVGELVGRPILDLYADTPHGKTLATKVMKRLRNGDQVCNEELQMQAEGIPSFWVSLTMTPTQNEQGKVFESRLMIVDISKRKQAEDIIKKSLAEKEILIKEIHHRVKNNLQTICSFLFLQEHGETNTRAIEVLRNAQRRVRAIARIHEHIHRAADLNSIIAKDYLGDITRDAIESFSTGEKVVSFRLVVDDIILGVDQAIPCGQIVSELLSNCLKYAFPKDKSGSINVSLRHHSDGMLVLIVADDGKGFPENFDIDEFNGLGLRIVRILTAQLKGTLNINGNNSNRIKIIFPEEYS